MLDSIFFFMVFGWWKNFLLLCCWYLNIMVQLLFYYIICSYSAYADVWIFFLFCPSFLSLVDLLWSIWSFIQMGSISEMIDIQITRSPIVVLLSNLFYRKCTGVVARLRVQSQGGRVVNFNLTKLFALETKQYWVCLPN